MNVDMLLRPDGLSDEELINILISLNVAVSSDFSRSQLLSIFKRVALPLPQREMKCKNHNFSRIDSTIFNYSGKLATFEPLKREQIPVADIVDITKKIKLSPEDDADSNAERVLQNDFNVFDLRQENLKRRISMHLPVHQKRMKISSPLQDMEFIIT